MRQDHQHRPDVKVFYPLMKLMSGNFSTIMVDQKGQLWQFFDENKVKNHCHYRCNIVKKRIHATCLFCRHRARVEGRLPNPIRVTWYNIFRWVDRPNGNVKDAILKHYLKGAEWLAT